MRHTITRLLLAVLVIVQLSACNKGFLENEEVVMPAAPLQTMVDYLKYNYSFSMLYGALQKSGLTDMLSDTTKPFTLMAPDNAAFAKAGISQDSLDKMDPVYLKNWLSYHLLPIKLTYESIPAMLNSKYTTFNKQDLYISKLSGYGGAAVNAAMIVQFGTKREIRVANGIVYVLENTLALPAPSLKDILTNDPSYSRFGKALEKFGLLDQLAGSGPFVVLAVNNNWFISDGEMRMIDTVKYKKYLFDVYLLKGRFFFPTDFSLRPPPENSEENQYLVDKDGVLVISAYADLYVASLAAGTNPNPWEWGLGDQPSLQYPPAKSKLALNGILIDCPGTLIYPYNMTK